MRFRFAVGVLTLLLGMSLAGCTGSSNALPTVTSKGIGSVPQINFSNGVEPRNPMLKILNKADKLGPVVGGQDLVTVNYYGQIWGGDTTADSTLLNKTGAVNISLSTPPIIGWKQLAGTRVGERVMLVLPPKFAYGAVGNESLQIPKDATLVYIVDIMHTVNPAQADKMKVNSGGSQLPAGITVDGDLPRDPQLNIGVGSTIPTQPHGYVVALGTGHPVNADEYVAVRSMSKTWDNKPLASNWNNGGLQGMTARAINAVGVPVGSLIVVTYPATASVDAKAVLYQIVSSYPMYK